MSFPPGAEYHGSFSASAASPLRFGAIVLTGGTKGFGAGVGGLFATRDDRREGGRGVEDCEGGSRGDDTVFDMAGDCRTDPVYAGCGAVEL